MNYIEIIQYFWKIINNSPLIVMGTVLHEGIPIQNAGAQEGISGQSNLRPKLQGRLDACSQQTCNGC